MEGVLCGVAAIIAIILILMEKSDRGGGERYAKRETQDTRFSEVVDNESGDTVFVGTGEQCDNWIRENG